MKNLEDIKHDMSELYEDLRVGKCELKTAAELANIAGKFLKAEQLDLARMIFLDGKMKSAGSREFVIERVVPELTRSDK